MELENIIKEGKMYFAKQGLFNTRTDIDYLNATLQGKRGRRMEPHWFLSATDTDPNIWNVAWCIPEYKTNNGKIKQIVYRDGNLKYKSHAIQRIFERNGFDPVNLPKHIEKTEWINYITENNHGTIIIPEGVELSTSDIKTDNVDWEQIYKQVAIGIEPRIPIPFLDGLLIVSQRLGISGNKVKFRKKGCTETTLDPQRGYTAFTYLENLNEQQNNTLFYINNGQYSDAVESYKYWIKNVNEVNVLESNIATVDFSPI